MAILFFLIISYSSESYSDSSKSFLLLFAFVATVGYGSCYFTGITFIGASSYDSSEINPFLAGFYTTLCFVAIIGLDAESSSLSSNILRFFCCWRGLTLGWAGIFCIKGWLLAGTGLDIGPLEDPSKGLVSFGVWFGNKL